MTKPRNRLYCLLLCACAALVLGACSSIDCPVQNTVFVHYGVYSRPEVGDTLRDTMSVYARRADHTDTLLLNRGINLTSFALPVSYSHPEDTLRLHFSSSARSVDDTLWIKKDNLPHFESVDCAAAFFHRITAVRSTHRYIDSVSISNPTVDYDPSRENIRIFFKAAP